MRSWRSWWQHCVMTWITQASATPHAADNGHGSQIHIRLNLRACGECKCVKVAFVFKGQACYFFGLYSGQCIAKMV